MEHHEKNRGLEVMLGEEIVAVPVTEPNYWPLIGMFYANVIQGCDRYAKNSTITFEGFSKCLDHYHAYVKKNSD